MNKLGEIREDLAKKKVIPLNNFLSALKEALIDSPKYDPYTGEKLVTSEQAEQFIKDIATILEVDLEKLATTK